jgi:hypothetical protein
MNCGLRSFTQIPNAREGNLCFKAEITPLFIESVSTYQLIAHDPHRDLVVYVDTASDIAIRIAATGRIVLCSAAKHAHRMVKATDASKLRLLAKALAPREASVTQKKAKGTAATYQAKEFFQRGIAAYRAAAKARGYKVVKSPTGLLEAFGAEDGKLRGRYDHAKEKNAGWLK